MTKLPSSTHYVTGRRRPGRRPERTTFEKIGAIEGNVALIVEGEEAHWRMWAYAMLRAEAGEDYEHPKDWRGKHRYSLGTRIVVPFGGKIHIGIILATFEAGQRLRYQVLIAKKHKLAFTEGQLMALTKRAAMGYLPHTQTSGSGRPPNEIGSKLAADDLPPLKWVAQSAALRQRMFWPSEE